MQRLYRPIPYLVGAASGCALTVTIWISLAVFFSNDGTDRNSPKNVVGESAATDLETATSGGIPSAESASFQAVFEHQNKILRLTALYKLVENGDEHKLIRLARQATGLESDSERNLVQETVFRRLSVQNPVRSLELVKTFPDQEHDHMLRAVFNEWFYSDLDSAISHARTLEEDSKILIMHEIVQSRLNLSSDKEREIARQLDVVPYFAAWSKARLDLAHFKDPKARWYKFVSDSSLDADTSSVGLLSQIAHSWIKQAGIDVIGEICSSLSNSEIRGYVAQLVLMHAARIDPKGTLELARDLPGIDNDLAVLSVLSEWGRQSPVDALEAANSYGEDGRKQRYLQGVVTAWAYKDPQGILDELDSVPVNFQSMAQRLAIRTIVRADPVEAAKYLPQVEDLKTKAEMSGLIAKEWSRIDVDAALDWILSNEDLASDLQTIGAALHKLAYRDSQLAMEKALSQTVPESSVGPETFVLAAVSEVDIDKAISMESSMRKSSKPLSHKFIAYYLMSNNETERAVEFGESIAAPYRKDYFIYLFGQWRQSNHHALVERLEQFASDDVKYYAARVLHYENERFGILSDEDLRAVESILNSTNIDGITDSQIGLAAISPHSFLLGQGR